MREEDKPFICYKSRTSMKIQPRGAEGWKHAGLWQLPFLTILGIYIWVMSTYPRPVLVAVYTALHLAATGVWLWQMMRWMKARSEIIDLDKMVDLKRQQDEALRRGRK